MGRNDTGAQTTDQVVRIELSFMLSSGKIIQGKNIIGSMSWTGGSSVQYESNLEGGNSFLRIHYTHTHSYTKVVTKVDYKIQITSTPSNLGRGDVLYFLCPINGKRCRILYSAYSYPYFKSRTAYKNRLYYPSQLSSQKYRSSDMYFSASRKIDELVKKQKKQSYKGKPTRLDNRVDQWCNKSTLYHNRMDLEFYRILMKSTGRL